MNALRRIWRGIVVATAGGVLSVLIQMIGQMTVGLSIDYLASILAACAGGGFLLGVSLPLRGTKHQSGSIKT